MKVRTARAGGALIAALLVAPLGVGMAAAETVPDPAAAESVEAPVATEEVADPATEDATEAPASEVPAVEAPVTEAPASDLITPAAAPVGVELNSLKVAATVAPLEQLWHSSGVYSAIMTVQSITGIEDDNGVDVEYPLEFSDVVLSYNLNAAGAQTFVPNADGTFLVTGLIEGENLIGLQATFDNTEGAQLTISATRSIKPVVLTQAETVELTWSDTEAGGYEDTLYQGDEIIVTSPAGSFEPGETVTLFVFDENGAVVDTLTLTAESDGSLTYTYPVPADMDPADYLLYFEGESTVMTFLLHVLEPDEVITDPGVTDPAVTDPGTTTVTTTNTTPTPTTGTMTSTLATTGSESSAGLLAAGLATLAGAGLVTATAMVRRRRSQI